MFLHDIFLDAHTHTDTHTWHTGGRFSFKEQVYTLERASLRTHTHTDNMHHIISVSRNIAFLREISVCISESVHFSGKLFLTELSHTYTKLTSSYFWEPSLLLLASFLSRFSCWPSKKKKACHQLTRHFNLDVLQFYCDIWVFVPSKWTVYRNMPNIYPKWWVKDQN